MLSQVHFYLRMATEEQVVDQLKNAVQETKNMKLNEIEKYFLDSIEKALREYRYITVRLRH